MDHDTHTIHGFLTFEHGLPSFADSEHLDLFIGSTITHLSLISYGKLFANNGFSFSQ